MGPNHGGEAPSLMPAPTGDTYDHRCEGAGQGKCHKSAREKQEKTDNPGDDTEHAPRRTTPPGTLRVGRLTTTNRLQRLTSSTSGASSGGSIPPQAAIGGRRLCGQDYRDFG